MGGRGAKSPVARELTNGKNNDIISKRVPFSETNKTIHADKQQQHILGTAEWLRESKREIAKGKNPKSAFYRDVNAQEIVDNFSGKGIIQYSSKSCYPEEYVDMGKNIGVTYDKKVKKYIHTSRIKIVYSQKGAHAFPVLKKGGDKK